MIPSIVLSAAFVLNPLSVTRADAAVNYDEHQWFEPPNWNGRIVYISPGHTIGAPNSFPCYYGGASERSVAWETAYNLKDILYARGYRVLMPRSDIDVSLTDRIDTAYDYWQYYGSGPLSYLPMHSNAHNLVDCGHDGGFHGGTQLLLDGNVYDVDRAAAGDVFTEVSAISPGWAHEFQWEYFCGYKNIYELCSWKAQAMPTT